MTTRQTAALSHALAMVAPGTPLRDGLDRILRAKRGALVVVGDGHEVLSICSGGFLLDAEFSPQRLSELAKMDGAIIVAKDSSRIARANVQLMPDPSITTTETGTRHRTAERVARSIDVPVLSISAAMSVIAVYRNDHKHVVQPTGWLHDRTDQALATMQRFRNRFDVALNGLSILEVEDSVSVGDVVGVVQAAEMVLRIAEEVDGYLVELGEDGRLVGLQSAELVDGVAPALHLVVRDYCDGEPAPERVPSSNSHGSPGAPVSHKLRSKSTERLELVNTIVNELSELPSDGLSDPKRVAEVLRLPGTFDDAHSGIEPRGYRLLYRLPRFSDAIIERIVDRFLNLQQIMRASLSELEQVEGVGETRAHSVKDGLARLAEASIFERYQ
ncbi:MAG: DNA integrity scanning diadenylate cyclase DisA [Acidimicrobiales bacterium]